MKINYTGFMSACLLQALIMVGCGTPASEKKTKLTPALHPLTHQTQHMQQPDSPDISGAYEEADDREPDSLNEGCHIIALITKDAKGYTYRLTTPENHYKGKLTVNSNPDKTNDIVFEGIPFAEYEGDISKDGSDASDNKLKKPTGLGGVMSGDTIDMQNYGNSMNYYVQLGDCGLKFIRLIKNKKAAAHSLRK